MQCRYQDEYQDNSIIKSSIKFNIKVNTKAETETETNTNTKTGSKSKTDVKVAILPHGFAGSWWMESGNRELGIEDEGEGEASVRSVVGGQERGTF